MLVVVGGHSRNIGKTSVVAGLIQALPQGNWTAMKITQFGHGICTASGVACDCHLAPERPYAIAEEHAPGPSDSARFLAAGARRSYWIRTAQGCLFPALTAIRDLLASSENLIIESNSILQYLTPDLYIVVLDFGCEDFKASSLRFLKRADALVINSRGRSSPLWKGVEQSTWESKPRFPIDPPSYLNPELVWLVNNRLRDQSPLTSTSGVTKNTPAPATPR